jgi:hypothetical protein
VHVRSRRIWTAVLGAGLTVLAAQAFGAAPAAASTLPVGTVKAFTTQTPFDANPVKTFSASCPAGQRVLGGGALTVGGIHAVITEMQPVHPTTGVDRFQVTAAADQFGIAGVWSFQVYAFCAVVPASAQLEIVSHKNLPTSQFEDQANTRCSPGKTLVGTGGKIDNGQGQVDLGMVPNSSGIVASGSAAIATEDADGFAGQYTVTGYSVCARENQFLDFQMVRTSSVAPQGQSSLRQTVFCPSGMAVTGLAGLAEQIGSHLQTIRPDRANSPAFSASFGIQAVPPSPTFQLQLDATVFCAR